MELVEGDALVGESRQRRCMDLAAKRIGQAEADVIEKDDEDVRRIGRKMVRFSAPDVLRFLQRRPGGARRGNRRERQNRAQCVADLMSERRGRFLTCNDHSTDGGDDFYKTTSMDVHAATRSRALTNRRARCFRI